MRVCMDRHRKTLDTSNVKLLGIVIDNKLKFARHLCSKAILKQVFSCGWLINIQTQKKEMYKFTPWTQDVN